MIAQIRLNKRNKTIKVVNRKQNLRLQHTGKTGPQGASVSSRWGTIVGSINDQDDLFAYLASKADTSDLGSAAFKDSSFFASALGSDENYVTDAQQTVLSNTSGTNTGDETTSTIKTKLGITTLSGSNTGDQDLSVLQPKDATLTSLAAYNTNGLLTQTSADTFTGRTITGTTNQVTVTNGDGVSGNPTLSLPQNIHTGATPTFAGVNFGAGALESTRVWINNDTPITFGGGAGNSSSFKAGSDGTFLFDVGGNVNIALKGGDASGNSYMRYTDSSWNMAWQVDTLGRMTVRSGGSIGTSSSYIPNTYTSRLYLNSTAYIDGATAGVIGMSATTASATAYQFSGVTSGTILEVSNSTNDAKFAIRTTGTSKGAYNYLQGTTNYISTVGEVSGKLWWRVGSFGGNNFTIRTNNDGFSGYSDAIALMADGSQQVSLPATSSISTGTFTGLKVSPTLTQSGTANYTALLINPTETSTGSGTKLLIDAQVGGTSKFKVDNAGNTTLVDAANIAVGTTTGTKLGTATSQKLSFWNATPIVQPTTSVGASTFTANSGTAVNDASTFDGYTIKQVVKALRNIGLLA